MSGWLTGAISGVSRMYNRDDEKKENTSQNLGPNRPKIVQRNKSIFLPPLIEAMWSCEKAIDYSNYDELKSFVGSEDERPVDSDLTIVHCGLYTSVIRDHGDQFLPEYSNIIHWSHPFSLLNESIHKVDPFTKSYQVGQDLCLIVTKLEHRNMVLSSGSGQLEYINRNDYIVNTVNFSGRARLREGCVLCLRVNKDECIPRIPHFCDCIPEKYTNQDGIDFKNKVLPQQYIFIEIFRIANFCIINKGERVQSIFNVLRDEFTRKTSMDVSFKPTSAFGCYVVDGSIADLLYQFRALIIEADIVQPEDIEHYKIFDDSQYEIVKKTSGNIGPNNQLSEALSPMNFYTQLYDPGMGIFCQKFRNQEGRSDTYVQTEVEKVLINMNYVSRPAPFTDRLLYPLRKYERCNDLTWEMKTPSTFLKDVLSSFIFISRKYANEWGLSGLCEKNSERVDTLSTRNDFHFIQSLVPFGSSLNSNQTRWYGGVETEIHKRGNAWSEEEGNEIELDNLEDDFMYSCQMGTSYQDDRNPEIFGFRSPAQNSLTFTKVETPGNVPINLIVDDNNNVRPTLTAEQTFEMAKENIQKSNILSREESQSLDKFKKRQFPLTKKKIKPVECGFGRALKKESNQESVLNSPIEEKVHEIGKESTQEKSSKAEEIKVPIFEEQKKNKTLVGSGSKQIQETENLKLKNQRKEDKKTAIQSEVEDSNLMGAVISDKVDSKSLIAEIPKTTKLQGEESITCSQDHCHLLDPKDKTIKLNKDEIKSDKDESKIKPGDSDHPKNGNGHDFSDGSVPCSPKSIDE